MALPRRADSAVDQPTKLFIGGITKTTTTKQLREHFQQHGRVLDCIAMRQADGRARGFGYVTLDSRSAAEKCVIAPQIVDNRVVDVKLAVPEGSSISSAPTTPMNASSPPFTPGSLWGTHHGANAHGFDVMPWAYQIPSLHSFDDPSSFDRSTVFEDSNLAMPCMQAEPMSVRSTLLENDGKAVSRVATAEPRRGLGDITNKTHDPPVGKKCFSASVPEIKGGCMIPSESTKQDTMVASAEPSAQLPPASGAVANNDFPSVGSALHASGECHRCNFFSKGRCANGRDCSFCHFEHEKRKLSRQEKRERRDKWLIQQTAQEESMACSESERSESNDSSQSNSFQRARATTAPPGLSPLKPAADLGESAPSNMPLVPPGAFLPSLLAASPSASLSSLRPPPLQLLSTTPSPMPTPLASGKSASPGLFATAGLEHAFADPPVRVTAATQTEPEPCELCGQHGMHAHCEATIAPERFSANDVAKSTWSKQELLRLRCSESVGTWIIRMHPADQLDAC